LLLSDWRHYSPALRNSVLHRIFQREDWLSQLLKALEMGVIAPTEIPAAGRQRLLKQAAPDIKARATALFGSGKSESRAALIERYRSVPQLVGDPSRGVETFTKV